MQQPPAEPKENNRRHAAYERIERKVIALRPHEVFDRLPDGHEEDWRSW